MNSIERIFGLNGAGGKPLHLCPNCEPADRTGFWDGLPALQVW